jgi:hypothetical protein
MGKEKLTKALRHHHSHPMIPLVSSVKQSRARWMRGRSDLRLCIRHVKFHILILAAMVALLDNACCVKETDCGLGPLLIQVPVPRFAWVKVT